MEQEEKKGEVDQGGCPGAPSAGGEKGPIPLRGEQRDVQVMPGPQRRTFTADYKLRVLEEADRSQDGELGALLRREGLYHSHLQKWRQQRLTGTLSGLQHRRGPKPKSPDMSYVKKLERENERLRKKLALTETILDIQKKVLGIQVPELSESDA